MRFFTSAVWLLELLVLVVVDSRLSDGGTTRRSSQQLFFDIENNNNNPQVVSGGSQLFVPLQLGPDGVPFALSVNDLFRGYKLDTAEGESSLKSAVFTGQTEDVPFVHTYGSSKVVQTSQELMNTFGVEGALSVSYAPMISGQGAVQFLKKYVKTRNQVSLLYRVTHTAFSRKAKIQTMQLNGSPVGKGTRFIESIIYGAQLDIRFTISSDRDVNVLEIETELQGKIGVAPLSGGFLANFVVKDGETKARYTMEIETKASGVNFPVPPTLSYENFNQTNTLIQQFNTAYQGLFNSLAGLTTVDAQTNVLRQLTPIGFTLGQIADYTDSLNLFSSLALERRLQDFSTIFLKALQWQATLERALEVAEAEYGADAALRTNYFRAYETNVVDYQSKLNAQIAAGFTFRQNPINGTMPVTFPQGFDQLVMEGLTGQGYIAENLVLLGTTYVGLHYVGFTIPVNGASLQPWLSGSARTNTNAVVAYGKTPEELKRNLDNPNNPLQPLGQALVTFYENKDFQGRALPVASTGHYDVNFLDFHSFNDIASSMKLATGYAVILCYDANFVNCKTMPLAGSHPEFGVSNEQVSSFILFEAAAIMYADEFFGGFGIVAAKAGYFNTDYLTNSHNLNKKGSSLYVKPGFRVLLCYESNFRNCQSKPVSESKDRFGFWDNDKFSSFVVSASTP